MADIFISYAREDLRWASNLTQALNSYGWSTWWDPEIPSGKEYDEIIEEELSSARCIIVGWSEQSIRSRWVKDEAREAVEQGKIIPEKIHFHNYVLKKLISLAGLLLLVLCLLVYLISFLGGVAFFTRLMLVASLIAVVWSCLGTAMMRTLAFPLGFLFFMVPITQQQERQKN